MYICKIVYCSLEICLNISDIHCRGYAPLKYNYIHIYIYILLAHIYCKPISTYTYSYLYILVCMYVVSVSQAFSWYRRAIRAFDTNSADKQWSWQTRYTCLHMYVCMYMKIWPKDALAAATYMVIWIYCIWWIYET